MFIRFMLLVVTVYCEFQHSFKIMSEKMLSLTEILTLDVNNEISGVTETEPKLWQYSFYPELFLVDANFCEV